MWLQFKCVNFKHSFGIGIVHIQVNITLEWTPEDPIDGESLVEVMCPCPTASMPMSMLTEIYIERKKKTYVVKGLTFFA